MRPENIIPTQPRQSKAIFGAGMAVGLIVGAALWAVSTHLVILWQ